MRKTLILVSMTVGLATVASAALAPAIGHPQTPVSSKAAMMGKMISEPVANAASKVNASARTADYDYETVEIGTSQYDYQHNGSHGKMVAVSSDGVVHASYMGGTDTANNRRVMAVCVDGTTITGPATNVLNTKTGYTTCAVTSATPVNALEGNTTVVGLHSALGSWFCSDFDGCTMAFSSLMHSGSDQLWPHISLDINDKIHMACGDASEGDNEDAVWFTSSTSGSAYDNSSYVQLTNNSNVLSMTTAAAKTGQGAAVLFMQDATNQQDMFSGGEGGQAPQWHHDIFVYEAHDASNDLLGAIAETDPVNITKYMTPGSRTPFAYGAFAYADVDAIYDRQASPELHIAFSTPMCFQDTIYLQQEGSADTLFWNDTIQLDYFGAIWHYNFNTESWSMIAGMMTPEDESDVAPDPGVFRIARDRVQLAVDEDTGYLYAIWNQYSDDDRRAAGSDGLEMANGEIFAACSNDNGETWGEPVNLTNTQTPGCEAGDCNSETFGSLAEVVTDGYLHITFMNDLHAGSYIRADDPNDGSELTTNPMYYMRVPVSAVPAPEAPRAAHIGLYPYKRQYGFYSSETTFSSSLVRFFNESDDEMLLESVVCYHDQLDDIVAVPDAAGHDFKAIIDLRGDPLRTGVEWVSNETSTDWNGVWDGRIQPWTVSAARLLVRPVEDAAGLPLREQAFEFIFYNVNTGERTHRFHRYTYLYADGTDPLVEEIDMDNLDSYAATTIYSFDVAVDEQPAVVRSLDLGQNYPNPFNPTTAINFTLPSAGETSLKVYNLSGELVSTLVDGQMTAGAHKVHFDGSAMASGVYFYTLENAGMTATRKMVLVK